VLSPPTSTTSAPSATISRPRAMAASASSQRPPSEKESGVTFRTPMTSGRTNVNLPAPCATTVLRAVDELQGFVAGGHAVAELPLHRRSDGDGAGLAHAAHRHAEVLGLDDDEHTPRLQRLLDLLGDLGREPLLDLGPPREGVDQAGQLGQTGDAPVG